MPKPQTYQQKRQALDVLLAELQNEALDVDEALKKYEAGLQLIQELQQYLSDAEHKITTIKAKYK